ncbi:MAG: DUF427 domain-containing protein [Xanthobacteraceae bacterium]|nr:DUF427 domain-containing protein [Xanthobacteraceae bacterium]
MKIPGPDHPITIEPTPGRIRVSVDGVVVAETEHALTLRESTYPAVQYIPRADADHSLLSATDHKTYCPYKGDASYLSISVGGRTIENAIWSYEQPHDAVKQIAGHLAFYSNKVTIEELS